MTRSGRLSALGLPVAAVLLAGCQSGPASVADGSYTSYAVGSGVGELPSTGLVIRGDTVTLTGPGLEASARVGAGSGEYILCPPDGKGTPLPVGQAITIGTLTLTRPAIFGDCGQTRPLRVTLVDLASADGQGGPFPFTRWVEFCDTSDADCP
jgi:hypothetical protein